MASPVFGIDYGLLPSGFVPLTTQQARDKINDGLQSAFGASFDVSDGSAAGQVAGIVAATIGELWEVAEQLDSSADPDKATGPQQDAVCAITGTVRLPATYSTDTLTLTGTPTTLVGVGSQAQAASTSSKWQTLADATIATLSAWVALTPYTTGDRVTNSSRTYVCIADGTSAASGGPATTAADITDGSVHWRYMGDGTGAVDVAARAAVTGPTVAVSGDITIIVTPVGGWTNVINLLDAVPGRAVETDEQLRVRREEELAAAGASTAANIRALLLKITGVTAAHVFHNDTDLTDVDGVPPHAIEALVQGGADQDIIDVLGEEVAAGITTHGSGVGAVTGTHVDSEGVSQVINFTRPGAVTIYVDITLTKDPATYTGDATVKSAIAAYGLTQGIGDDAVAARIGSSVFPVFANGVLVQGVKGVLDVPRSGSLGGTLIKVTATPTADTTITITSRQIATYDTSRVTVHSSNGTP